MNKKEMQQEIDRLNGEIERLTSSSYVWYSGHDISAWKPFGDNPYPAWHGTKLKRNIQFAKDDGIVLQVRNSEDEDWITVNPDGTLPNMEGTEE